MNFKVLLALVFLSASLCSGYRIFAIFPFKGRSHFKMIEAVVKALAEKGHQVDVISAFPLETPFPNYTDVVKLTKTQGRLHIDYQESLSRSAVLRMVHKSEAELCELLGHPEIARIVKNPPTDPPYDLVLTHYFASYQCFAGIGYLWDVPVAGVVTTAPYAFNHRLIGSPLNLAIAPKNLRWHRENMTFAERLYNVVVSHFEIQRYDYLARNQDELIKKYLGPQLPTYAELEKCCTSLLITNSHYSFHGIQPRTPAHIEVAGIHIQDDDNATMPIELKKILDESKSGFVYFSFGSLVNVESIPRHVFHKMYDVFRRIAPVRVFMKSVDPDSLPEGKPDNLFTFSWFPQEQVLKHPNIKGFVTHGGGLGTQEAVYYAVPLICIPLFADQFINCDIATNKKFGITLNIDVANQADYDYAFDQILNNPAYRESMNKVSKKFRDRPLKPKDEVAYWVEYVIRHGKNSLRSQAVDLPWWQSELLDVYAFIVISVAAVFSALIVVVRRLVKFTLRKFKSSSMKKVSLEKKLK